MPTDASGSIRPPAGFWDRADVIDVLTARDIGALFRLLRQYAHTTQTQLERATGIPQPEVSRIQRGQRQVITHDVLTRIADGLHMPDQARGCLGLARRASSDVSLNRDQPEILPRPALRRNEDATEDYVDGALLLNAGAGQGDTSPMHRRTVLSTFVVLGSSAAHSSLFGRTGQERTVGHLGPSDTGRLLRQAERLYALDYQHGGDTLWNAAHALADDAYLKLEHGIYSEESERDLLRAIGRMLMCAGWLAFDAGQQDVARSLYNEALSLAHQGGDTEVQTHALANLAFQSNVLGRPREGLRYANAAASAANATDAVPRITAIPQLRLSVALALSLDASGSSKAIGMARSIMDLHADKATAAWCAFLGPAELDGVEGTCAIELGQLDRAERLLLSAIQAHPDEYARNRALYRVRLARARFDSRAIDGAGEAANAALDDLNGHVASWRVTNELDDIAGRIAPYRNVDEVDRFLNRYTLISQ